MDPKTKTNTGGKPVKKAKQSPPALKFIKTVFKILFIMILALMFAGAGIAGGMLYGYISTATPITAEDLAFTQNLTTKIYDRDGNEIDKLTGYDNQDRILVFDKDGEIPQYLKDAIVAIEDERFYNHNGVDWKRTIGATINYFVPFGGSFGGSTITQQVVKNITGDDERTPRRKVQEAWRALQLEKRYEKWQILEAYMNLVYLGNSCYGVQSASYKYFGKPVKELSLAQCASLAGIIQTPGKYDPFTEEGRKNNKKRQELVLGKMLELGKISQEEYDLAIKDDLEFTEKSTVKATSNKVNSYFVDQVIRDVLKDLVASGLDEEYAKLKLYSGGLTIKTTVDMDIQNAMDQVFKDPENFPGGEKQGYTPQAAMAIMDPKTGEILAMYGGSGEKTADLTLNRVTQMRRAAGSSFKPIAVYGPALDQHLITAATVIDDVPVYMNPQKPEQRYPVNFAETINGVYARHYRGLISIRTAVQRSVNVVAARVWKDILGGDLSFEYLKKSGISMEGEGKYVSIAMGGLSNGVSPLQMTAAYVPFVNDGIYMEPITYTQVLDNDGSVLLDKKKTECVKQKQTIVYDEATAFVMTDLLRSVTASGGTASYVKLTDVNGKSIPCAGKTGTSEDDVDRWYVGYTPDFVAAVWYGYDKNITVELPSGSRNPAANIWMKVLQNVYDSEKLESRDFEVPEGVVKKQVCAYSGKIPTELCSKDPRGNAVRTEYFIKGTEPRGNDKCDVHVSAKIDIHSKDLFGRPLLATEYTPLNEVEERVFILRREPYKPKNPGDPYPLDWKYELPVEYSDRYTSPPKVENKKPAQSSPSGESSSDGTSPNNDGSQNGKKGENGLSDFINRLGETLQDIIKPDNDRNTD
ncbi:transglycosylase domain-containing protein [Clostridium thermosuccinogenes]|uniref:transglycosylase domain-containing protein n=1 Tax=Clostridium thermosuccinogenes TaxID=84032 RepID=UPI000CCBDFEF|nr:transglycosylase domain-containing protein [Pseudoclostridium thermosuccinogenes]PNT93715.1 hypothetical protein CDQ83_09550 [Pseudoclostridium thermosuccinogenes]